jgi:hypothetical protein
MVRIYAPVGTVPLGLVSRPLPMLRTRTLDLGWGADPAWVRAAMRAAIACHPPLASSALPSSPSFPDASCRTGGT